MAMTVALARTHVSRLVDDPNLKRWDVTAVDRALRVGVPKAARQYASRGGRAFDITVSGTTDANGRVAMTAYELLLVRGVQVISGGTLRHALRAGRMGAGDAPLEQSGLSLEVLAVRAPVYPESPTAGDQLVQDGAGNALWTDPQFEELCCLEAALQLISLERNPRQAALEQLRDEHLQSLVGAGLDTPRSGIGNAPRGAYEHQALWIWNEQNERIELWRRLWHPRRWA